MKERITKDNLFKPIMSRAETKDADRTAKSIMDAEATKRREKTAKLRIQRLAQNEEHACPWTTIRNWPPLVIQ
jgi:hypothetical protein